MSLWDYSNYEMEDLTEASELIARLDELGFPTLPDEARMEMNKELLRRI